MKISFDLSFNPPAAVGSVVLRSPELLIRSSPIVVQIDTGADISLLPRSSVTQEFLLSSESVLKRITGYDGTSRYIEAVELQIVFEGVRFTGEFCLIDDQIGILGRDILNHFSLLLDGPELLWEVVPNLDQ